MGNLFFSWHNSTNVNRAKTITEGLQNFKLLWGSWKIRMQDEEGRGYNPVYRAVEGVKYFSINPAKGLVGFMFLFVEAISCVTGIYVILITTTVGSI